MPNLDCLISDNKLADFTDEEMNLAAPRQAPQSKNSDGGKTVNITLEGIVDKFTQNTSPAM